MSKRKKAKKNEDFKKVKLKVGKILKKTNTTETTINSRKVILINQLQKETSSSASAAVSYRGLSLHHLCTQLGHYSKNVRKNAIVGAKQILASAPHLIDSHLRLIVPAFARLISSPDMEDSSIQSQLRSLLVQMCSVSPRSIAPHFPLFTAHLLRAFTHLQEDIRGFAISVLQLLLDRYPELCRNTPDIFPSTVQFIASGKKAKLSSRAMLEFVNRFLQVYLEDTSIMVDCKETVLSFESGQLSQPIDLVPERNIFGPFHCPVLHKVACPSSSLNPLEDPLPFLEFAEAVAPLLTRHVLDYKPELVPFCVKCLKSLEDGSSRIQGKNLIKDYQPRWSKCWASLKKAVKMKNDRKLIEAIKWLEL